MRKRSFLLTAGACLAALALGAGSALADPPAGADRPLVGVGSDTTQDVMNAFANGDPAANPPYPGVQNPNPPPTLLLSSFNATGSATIDTHPGLPAGSPCHTFPRPAGSGSGMDALQNDTNGCIQFARSSSDQHNTRPTLTFFPFAQDTVTYASRTASAAPPNRTVQQLHDLYSCATPSTIQPTLPHFGSGSRTFFLSALGLTDSATYVQDNPCVIDTLPNGTPIEEHDGRQIQGNSWINLYSVAQYTTQTIGVTADRHGVSILRGINGNDSHSSSFPAAFVRQVFNVVRNADANNPQVVSAFSGGNSQICQHPEMIGRYGFKTINNCGQSVVN
jgi:hypothetical protein